MKMATVRTDLRVAVVVLVSLVGWLTVWEALVRSHVLVSSVLPSPSTIVKTMFEPRFHQDVGGSAIASTFGWTIGAWVLGTCIGLALVAIGLRLKFVSHSLAFVLLAGRTLPSVIAIPIFAAGMGIGRRTGFACAAFLCVCYCVPTLDESMKSVAASRRVLRDALGLGGWQAFWLVVFPGIGRAVRAIGVQSFGIALVVTVAGEMLLSIDRTVGAEVANLAWLVRMVEVYALVGWLILCSIAFNIATYLLPHILAFPAKRIALFMERRLGEGV
ncbi:MAG: hypothetical protein ACM336_21180 [Acidobacteriota bacterium]